MPFVRKSIISNKGNALVNQSQWVYGFNMKSLIWKATWQGTAGLIFFAGLVFATRGRWDYWRGWLFLAVFTASTFGLTAYMALYDKPLLARRLNAGPWKEEETSQKIIV